MSDDIRAMMELKISAVKRIVEAAENMAFDKQNEPVPEDFQFYNSKEMEEPYDENTITTTPEPEFVFENWVVRPPTKNAHMQNNPHFSDIPVNINFSSVHIPTNVYAWGKTFLTILTKVSKSVNQIKISFFLNTSTRSHKRDTLVRRIGYTFYKQLSKRPYIIMAIFREFNGVHETLSR